MALTTNATAGSDFHDAMKTHYLEPLNDTVNRASVLLDRLEKNSEDVDGNHAYVALISARNPGVGSRKDTSGTGPTLPAAGTQSYKAATFLMAYHYGRGSVSGPVMRASASKAGAFAKALDAEMQGLTARLPEDLNRQLWSYGHGRAATFSGNQSTSTLVTVNSQAIFSVKVGDRVCVANTAADGGITGTGTVVAINRDVTSTTHTVELSAASGAITASADALYFSSTGTNQVDVSVGQEMYGIPAVVDDGAVGADEGLGGAATVAAAATEFISGSLNYGGIARSSNTFWRGQMLQNSTAGTNRTLTVSLLEKAMLTGQVVGGAKEMNIEGYTNPGLWATIGLLHIGDRIYNDFKETVEGGWMAIKFNGRPIFYDRDAPRDKIWFLDMSTIMLLTQSGYEFMDDDGSILSRVSGVDAYEFTLYRDVQLGCRNAKPNVCLDDVTSVYNVEYDV